MVVFGCHVFAAVVECRGMPKSELLTRFDSSWEKLSSQKDGIPTLDEGGMFTGRTMTCEDGKIGVVWVITQELPHAPGSLRPHSRTIDLILPDGKRRFASDFGLSFSFNTVEIKKTLDAVEKIHPVGA